MEHSHQALAAPQEDSRQERAWAVLAGVSLCIFAGNASVAYYTFGVFLPEIISNTHWPASAVAAAIGPALLAASLVAPLAGWASDRLGARLVVIAGAPAIAIVFALLGLGTGSASGFAAAMVLVYVLYFAGSPVPHALLLAGWFNKRRGMALSAMFAAGSIGIALWPQYAAFLISKMGWRNAYAAMGASGAAVVLFAGLFLLQNPPKARSDIAVPNQTLPGLRVAEACRTARFWKLSATFLLLTAVLGGTAVVLPLMLRLKGADPVTAASIMSVVGIAMFAGRLSLGLTLDRFFAPYVTIGIIVIGFLAFVIMIAATSISAQFVAAAFLGFSLGSEYAVTAYLTSRAFGIRAFGSIYGLMTTATSIGAALGPALLGAALVSGMGIRTTSLASLAVLFIPALLLLTFRREDLPFTQ